MSTNLGSPPSEFRPQRCIYENHITIFTTQPRDHVGAIVRTAGNTSVGDRQFRDSFYSGARRSDHGLPSDRPTIHYAGMPSTACGPSCFVRTRLGRTSQRDVVRSTLITTTVALIAFCFLLSTGFVSRLLLAFLVFDDALLCS